MIITATIEMKRDVRIEAVVAPVTFMNLVMRFWAASKTV